jgi:hypothetical protein
VDATRAPKANNLSPPSRPPVISPSSHPRGAANRRHVVWRGGCGACGWSCDPLPGGFGNRPGGTTAPARGARYTTGRPTAPILRTRLAPGELASAGKGVRDRAGTGSAARGPQNRRLAERHGACGQWLNLSAPHPGSTDADVDQRASRRSAAPHHERRQDEPAGGDDACAREARPAPLSPCGRGLG